jgi:hypothetical protein
MQVNAVIHHRIVLLASIFVIGALGASSARAQTWSATRGRPTLWQITSVDATGEAVWPYGEEDIAGDGADAFEDDEAGADLRSVYADADAERLWLRAYVASEGLPSANAVGYFFLDIDANDASGGEAADAELWPELEEDPTAGGYERVIVASADGSLVGAFQWNEAANGWRALAAQEDELRVEVGVEIDPIRIGAPVRGYLQVDIDHAVSTLDASCDGNVFVRLWHEDPPARAFGDDDDEGFECRLPTDALGDPVVLREGECSDDDDCPAQGDCVDGVCLFTYECLFDADCPMGETCSSGACVREVDADCTSDAMCEGLVCVSGSCAACADNGARACEGDLVCSPDGSCVDTSAAGSGGASGAGSGGTGGAGGAAGAAGAMPPPGNVQGGAFHCAATVARDHGSLAWSALLCALVVLRLRRRANANANANAGCSV